MMKSLAKCLLMSAMLASASAKAQQPAGPSINPPAEQEKDSVLVTIVLKHQQDKNLPEIRRILEAQGFWDVFPPKDTRVVSWTLAVGLGHIVTLQVPTGSVRRLNLALENGAWGAFNTEVFLTYDYKNVWETYIHQREEAKEDRNR